jgi:predicted transposase YdaD
LWLTFLTQLNESNVVPPALLEEELTKEAVEYLESSSYSENELDIYDRYWDSVRTQRTLYTGAIDEGRAEGMAKGRAEGLAKGRAEGIEKGLAKGEAIGIEKGRAEGEAIGIQKGEAIGIEKGKALGLQKVIMNAHRAGKSLADIAALTELPEDEVRKIIRT